VKCLVGPHCGGRLRVIADVTDRDVTRQILDHIQQRARPCAKEEPDMDSIISVIEPVILVLEGAGVIVIVAGFMMASLRYFAHFIGLSRPTTYVEYRHQIGRSIIVGLEFLIAADIIKTVALDTDMSGVAVLGLIVLIRTFLTVALHVEMEGSWPWQTREGGSGN
jgi:uncharacterized membrane protein